MPLFSIIVVHHQGTHPHHIFLRGIQSLQNQTFRDFEILCYHDGPLIDASVHWPLLIKCTPQRHNDWGHSLRDIGIREARGEYIVIFNADNILYPNALETIAKEIARPWRIADKQGNVLDTNDIIIFPVLMFGLVKFRGINEQVKTDNFFMIFTGNPPVFQNIDAMQLVMKRSLWLDEGGWYDKSEGGDGHMYEKFCNKYGYRQVGPVLGEHH